MPKKGKKPRKMNSRMVLVPKDTVNDSKFSKLSKKHGAFVSKGLHNIGNTCYMNASLQCLARIPYFNELLFCYPIEFATIRRAEKDSTVSLKISLPATKYSVTAEYLELIINLRSEVQSHCAANTLNPSRLRTSVLQRYPRFGGFGQQDSHELLRALLDCLKQEELVRWKRGILDSLGIKGVLKAEDLSDTDRQMIRLWGRAVALATMVDRLFGGVLVNTLQCCGCGTYRTGFEPFLDLSLPMPEGGLPCKEKFQSSTGQGKSKQELKRERKKKLHKPRRDHRRRMRQEQVEPEDSPDEYVEQAAGQPDDLETAVRLDEEGGEAPRENHDEGESAVEDSTDSVLICTVNSSNSSPFDSRPLEHPLDTLPSETVVIEGCPVDNVSVAESLDKSSSTEAHADSCRPGDTTPEYFAVTTANHSIQSPASRKYSSSQSESSTSNGCCADIEDSDETGEYAAPSTIVDQSPDRPDQIATSQSERLDQSFSRLRLSEADSDPWQTFGTDEVNQAIRLSQLPVSPLHRVNGQREDSDGLTLYSCLEKFTAPERLTGPNRIICDACTRRNRGEREPVPHYQSADGAPDGGDVGRMSGPEIPVYQDSIRRDLILQPPPILTIHLKRFQQRLHSLQKSQKQISFPVVLDLGPFCSALSLNGPGSLSYRLHGVVEHLGRLADGHYVAYVPVTCKASAPSLDEEAISAVRKLVTHMTGRPLDEPPKWPWTVHDLVRRLRRCDHGLLLTGLSQDEGVDSFEEMASLATGAAVNGGGDVCGDTSYQDDRTWCRCSDSHVEQVSLSTVLRCQAFMLFYARVPTDN